MDTAIQTPGIGDNFPPSDIELLNAHLKEKNEGIEGRVSELYEAAHRVPDIKDADTADKVTVLIKQISKAGSNADKSRKEDKAPFLESGKTVDAFYKPFGEMLSKAKKVAGAKLTAYQVEQRQLADEAARKAREEAEAKAKAEREAAQNEVEKQRAEKALEKAANIKAADSSVRTNYGQTASLRTKTVFVIEDRAKVSASLLQYLSDDDILKAARAVHADGVIEIPGVSITQEQQAVVR
ncbi:hypothetical protein [Kiloniella majae]|uniref:hypothetical protein n=1 Tax=Kiloniella majae TaxID=1938558 RepID=UPI000A278323|nr:hypothetical protein [Kiloniella majae]